jgi:hypothetical protein
VDEPAETRKGANYRSENLGNSRQTCMSDGSSSLSGRLFNTGRLIKHNSVQ